jgi:predicted nucleic acid-binding protein
MANKIRRYWYSSCCFGFLLNQANRADKCGPILLDAEVGNCEIVISAWTMAEVLHKKGDKRPFPQESRELLRLFFNRSCFIVAEMDRFIAEAAQDVFWEHDILPKDAVHVATALVANANYLETFDGGLIAKSKLLGGEPLLVIQEPGDDRLKAEAKKAEKKSQIELPGTLSS